MHTIEDLQILITGGARFVGSHIAKRLTPCNDVHIVDNLSTGKQMNLPQDCNVPSGGYPRSGRFGADHPGC